MIKALLALTLFTVLASPSPGQNPGNESLTLTGALAKPQHTSGARRRKAAFSSLFPRPVSGVVQFKVPGSDPLCYEVDLSDALVQGGFARIYERESDSYPLSKGGMNYRDGNGMERGPDWLQVRCDMEGAWILGRNTLIIDYEDDIAGGPGPWGAEGVHRRRYVYQLVGRAMELQVIDLDEDIEGVSNYTGFFYGKTEGTEDPKRVEMLGALANPLIAFDGPANSKWFMGNCVDLFQSGTTQWYLRSVPIFTADTIDYGMNTFNRYRANSNGELNSPVNDTVTICVSQRVEDCFIRSASPGSPYRDYLSRRMVALFGAPTTAWTKYEEHLDQYGEWGMDDMIVYVFNYWSSSPADHLGKNVGPDWYPANDEGAFISLCAKAAQLGINFGALMKFSEFNPATGPPVFNVISDFARDATSVIKTGLQNGLPLFGTAAQGVHSEREHQLVKSNYGVSCAYIDVMTYASPSKGGDGDHVDQVAGSPQGKSLKECIAEQKTWFDEARRITEGPLLGEGSVSSANSNMEWLWGGYVDSVQRVINSGANLRAFQIPASNPRAITRWPVIPEFELHAAKPMQANHGNGFYDRFFGPFDGASFVKPDGTPLNPINPAMHDRYRAYEITYAHTPYVTANGPGDGPTNGNQVLLPQVMQEYYLLVELSNRYFRMPIQNIEYEFNGALQTFEQIWAITEDLLSFRDPKIRLDYGSLVIYVNHSPSAWAVPNIGGVAYSIPEDGWVAYDAADGFLSFSAIPAGLSSRIDYCLAPGRWEMFNGRGVVAGYGGITTGAPGDVGMLQIQNFVHNITIHEKIQTQNPDMSWTPSHEIVAGATNAVVSLEVRIDKPRIPRGFWAGAQAIAHYQNGAYRDVTMLVDWTSSAPGLVTVEQCGVLRGQGTRGVAQISCSGYQGAIAPPAQIRMW